MFTMSVFKTFIKGITKFNSRRFAQYLSQQELYILNEHDRVVLQLESNAVQDIQKSMNDLLKLCQNVAHLKHYVKGWELLANYFAANCRSLSNKDYLNYIQTFSSTGLAIEKIWDSACESFLEREFDEAEFFDALTAITPNIPNSQLLESVIEKYQKLEKSPKRAIDMLISIGYNRYEPNVKSWDIILQDLKKIDLTKIAEADLMKYVYAAGFVKDLGKQGETTFDKDVYSYFTSVMEKCGTATLARVFQYFDKLSFTTTDDLTRICILVSKGYRDITQSTKFEFYTHLLLALHHRSDLLKSLTANSKMLSFPIPSDIMIKEYKELSGILDNNLGIMEAKMASDSFWDKWAPEMGFNPQFAKDFSLVLEYGIDELEKDIKH
jgi:hypothetical protein